MGTLKLFIGAFVPLCMAFTFGHISCGLEKEYVIKRKRSASIQHVKYTQEPHPQSSSYESFVSVL